MRSPHEPSPSPFGERTASLGHAEAIELITAWLDHLGRQNDIRTLTIKGATLAHFGLRSPRTSLDVDVLVDPTRFSDYVELVKDAGWVEFPQTFQAEHFPSHSVTLRRGGWPVAIDIHRHYPGFLSSPVSAFETLWARRSIVTFAGLGCRTPDRPSSAIILALHSLRSVSEAARHAHELEELQSATFTDAEVAQIVAIATETRSAAPLASALEDMGIIVEVPEEEFLKPEYGDWVWRVRAAQGLSSHAAAAEWLSLLARTPLRRKFTVFWRAVWPTRADILTNRPSTTDSFGAILRARSARIARGLAALPAVVHRRRDKSPKSSSTP